MPGFGPLPPDLDIKKLISEIFGEPDKEPAGLQPQDRAKDADEPQTASASELSQRGATPPATADQPLPSMSLKDAPPEIVQRGNDPITRGQDAGGSPVEATVSVTPRRHGGALPKV